MAPYKRNAPAHVRVERRSDLQDRGYDTPCRIFLGAKSAKGYGLVQVESHRLGSAHRVMYEHHVGAIPEGLEIDHLCGQRDCCEPAHLEAVTHAENVRRAAARRTHCDGGHPLYGDNVRLRGSKRICRTCQREYNRRHRRLSGIPIRGTSE